MSKAVSIFSLVILISSLSYARDFKSVRCKGYNEMGETIRVVVKKREIPGDLNAILKIETGDYLPVTRVVILDVATDGDLIAASADIEDLKGYFEVKSNNGRTGDGVVKEFYYAKPVDLSCRFYRFF